MVLPLPVSHHFLALWPLTLESGYMQSTSPISLSMFRRLLDISKLPVTSLRTSTSLTEPLLLM